MDLAEERSVALTVVPRTSLELDLIDRLTDKQLCRLSFASYNAFYVVL
jgi:hypothetical protein